MFHVLCDIIDEESFMTCTAASQQQAVEMFLASLFGSALYLTY